MKRMMMLAATALTLSMATAQIAEARDGFYLAARGGLTWNNFNSKDDPVTDSALSSIGRVKMFAGAVGYRYKFFRGEFEFINRDDAEEPYIDGDGDHLNDISVGSTSYMFNGYLDFLPNYWITPYISGGIGWSKLELVDQEVFVGGETNKYKKSHAFTWQMGAGLSIRLNKCLNIDTGYRYFTLGKIRHAEVNAHEWYAGVRFTF